MLTWYKKVDTFLIRNFRIPSCKFVQYETFIEHPVDLKTSIFIVHKSVLYLGWAPRLYYVLAKRFASVIPMRTGYRGGHALWDILEPPRSCSVWCARNFRHDTVIILPSNLRICVCVYVCMYVCMLMGLWVWRSVQIKQSLRSAQNCFLLRLR